MAPPGDPYARATRRIISASRSQAARVLFSGDHVMAWNTTLIAPPEGSMADYISSLQLLLDAPTPSICRATETASTSRNER